MNKLVKSLILLMAVSHSLLAADQIPADAYDGCTDERFAIYHVNGIFSSELDAMENTKVLRSHLKREAEMYGVNPSCLYIDYTWNRTGSENYQNISDEAYDLYEAYSQWRKQRNSLLDFYQWIFAEAPLINGSAPALPSVTEAIKNAIEPKLAVNETVDEFANVYESANRTQNATVILVAHSQGNFFANSAHLKLVSDTFPSNEIHIVGVATPASSVEPEDRADLYTTNKGDFIRAVPDNLPAKDVGGYCESFVESAIASLNVDCHSFMATYLTEQQFRKSIFDDIFSIINPRVIFEAEQIFNIEAALPGLKINQFAFGSLNDDEYYLGAHEDYHRLDTTLYYVDTAQNTYSLITDGNGFVPYGVQSLVNYGSNFYFIAKDEVGESQLWTLDSFSRQRARKLNNYTFPIIQSHSARRLIKLENVLMVDAQSDSDAGDYYSKPHYVKYPGSIGTKTFPELRFDEGVDICSGAHTYIQVENRVYFLAVDCSESTRKSHIWSFSPSDIFPKAVQVPDIETLPKYAGFKSLGSHNGNLYFTNNVLIDGEVRQFLHTTDGIETTQLVEIPFPEEGDTTSLVDFLSVKNKLFIGFGSFGEKTVAVTDGTVDGTVFLDRALTGYVALQFGYDYGDYVVTFSRNESLDIRQLLIINVDTLELLTVPITGYTSAAFYNGELYYFLDGKFKRLSKDLVVEDIPWPLPNAPLWLVGRQDGLYALTDSPTERALFRLRE